MAHLRDHPLSFSEIVQTLPPCLHAGMNLNSGAISLTVL